MNDLKILNLEKNTLKLYIECFENSGNSKRAENIEWQFLLNPKQNQFVDIAIDESKQKTAAIYALFPVDFKLGNSIQIGTQSLDTITDIDYRGKGLFIKLAEDVYKKASKAGVSLVYGFPNGNSIYGFKKKLEWEVLDPVPFLIKPLKTRYFSNKISFLKFLPNINLSFNVFSVSKDFIVKESLSFPVEVNDLWQSFSKNIKVAVNRDKEYLDWRYIKKPNEDYKIVHCYDNSEKFLGFIIFCVKDKHEGRVAYIMELIYDLEHPKAVSQLLNYAIKEIKKENADLILAWCFDHSPNYKTFKTSYFFKLPEKLRPIELHFGAKAFDAKLKDIIYNRKNWYLSYSDSDTV